MTLQLRKFNAKSILFDYDYLLALDTDRCTFCLSPVTVALCISMLEFAGWKTRYFTQIGTEIDQDQIDQWSAKAQQELMVDNCISEIQVQQLIDQSQTQIYYNWSLATTNTEINNFAPVTTFIETSGDDSTTIQERDNALCFACQKFIDAMCLGIQETLHQATTLAQLGAVAVTIVGLLLAPWTGGASLLYATSIVSAIIYLGAGAFTFLSDAILEDDAARQEVACAMWNALRTLAPTKANLISASSGLTGLGTNATLIAAALTLVINEPTNQQNEFASFINVLGEGLVLANAGVLPACECCLVTDTLWDWYNTTDDLTGWTVGSTTDFDPSLITTCQDVLATYHMNLQINPDGMGHNFVANDSPFGGFNSDHYAQVFMHDFDNLLICQ